MALMHLNELATNTSLIFKRKYRWTFEVSWNGQKIGKNFVKLASRPNLTIEETEINYMHGKMWIPGKASWETITVTYYDVSRASGSGIVGLYSWLASIYNFQDTGEKMMQQTTIQGDATGGVRGGGWAGTGLLAMYDGCGTELENWQLKGVWPSAVNFGDLDYSSSEEVTIELTLRYYQAIYTNNPACSAKPDPKCVGC
jgi:hypothetical protein